MSLVPEDKNQIWMPYEEYVAYQRLTSEMNPYMMQRHAYFMWNNFSYDGFEEYYEKKFIKNKDNNESGDKGKDN